MDSPSNDDDRSLQMSKWMRRHDRADFMDMCAASPPSDGFFYANHSRIETRRTTPPVCEQTIAAIPTKASRESVSSQSVKQLTAGSITSLEMSQETGKIFKMDSHELENWAKTNIKAELHPYPQDDSASPLDSHNRVIPSIIKSDETGRSSGPLRLADRLALGTPDITPSTTPCITPAHSPQVVRRTNPFFTGDGNQKEEGNWLFRPGPKTDNVLYEAKVEIQATGGSQPPTKKWVPKPSQLRELNFFSPTSM